MKTPLIEFLEELFQRRNLKPSQMAAKIGVSHATVSRWLSGTDVPKMNSCRKIAEYSGVSLVKILSLVGYLPEIEDMGTLQWPEFREYARKKYPDELDEDLITMIEDLINRKKGKKLEGRDQS